MSVQFCLNPQTFAELKVDCRTNDNYQKLENLLNKFQHLDLIVKNEAKLCYKISNFVVKALEQGKLSQNAVDKVMAQFFAADVFQVSPEKQKCCLFSKDDTPFGVNKTLLRYFCKKLTTSISNGQTKFKTEYSTAAIKSLCSYLYYRKLPANLNLAIGTELYSFALSYDFAELAVECEKTIHSQMKKEIRTQKDLEIVLQQVVLTEKTAVIEKLALKAFLNNNSQAIKHEQSDQVLSLDASCMHLLLEEDILGRLLRNHVNGITISSGNIQDAAFLPFRINPEIKEKITHLTFDNPSRQSYLPLLEGGYFADEFPNVATVSLPLSKDTYQLQASHLSTIMADLSAFKKFSLLKLNWTDKVIIKFKSKKEWEVITNLPPIYSENLVLCMPQKGFFEQDDRKNFLEDTKAFAHFQNIEFHESYLTETVTYTCSKSVFQDK